MGQIADMEQLVNYVLGRDAVYSVFTIVAWVVLIYNIYKYGKKTFMFFYNKQKGIEESEEEQEDIKESVKKLQADLDSFKEIHQKDMDKIMERQDKIMQNMTESIEALSKEIEEEQNQSRQVDQSVLRSEIIRSFRDMLKSPDYSLSLTDKENFDSLFDSYFLRNGDGQIHELYEEYKAKVKVDPNSIL